MKIRDAVVTGFTAGTLAACGGSGGGGGSSAGLDPRDDTNTELITTNAQGYVLDDQGIANPWKTEPINTTAASVNAISSSAAATSAVTVNTAAVRMGLVDADGNRAISADGSHQRIAYYDSEFNENHEQLVNRKGTTTRRATYHNLAPNEDLTAGVYTHGTFGASLAAGRYGIAPGADLDLYAASAAEAGNPDTGGALFSFGGGDPDGNPIDFTEDTVTRGADVINFSADGNGTTEMGALQFRVGDAKRLKNSRIVFVKAAGNNAMPIIPGDETVPSFTNDSNLVTQADFVAYLANRGTPGGLGVLVGAANSSVTGISSFSNQPGGVKDNVSGRMLGAESFITAPGTGLPGATTNADGTEAKRIGTGSGTSYAAPIVTGTVAVMLERWDQLSPDEVIGIMFETADRDFQAYQDSLSQAKIDDMNQRIKDAYGQSDADVTFESERYDYTLSPVFGHGLLDIQNALTPQGTTIVATGASVEDGGAKLTETTMMTGPAFGDGLAESTALTQATFIDKYGRDFGFDMNAMVAPSHTLNHGLDYGAALGSLVAPGNTHTAESTGGRVSMRFHARGSRDALSLSGEGRPQYEALTAEIDFANGLSLGAYQANTESDAPWASNLLPSDGTLLMGVQGDGYLAAWDQASAVSAGVPIGGAKLTMTSVYADHSVHTDAAYRRDGKTANRQIMRLDTGIGDTHLQLGGGAVFQDDRLFGGRSTGAFGFGKDTTTYTNSIGAARDIGDVRIFGFHEQGRTLVNGTDTGLVAGFDGLQTAKTALGAERDFESARAGLVYSEPLRVTGGTATFNVPTGVSADGSVERSRLTESVSPEGHERRVEAYYHSDVSLTGMSEAGFKLNASLRHEPNNVADAPASAFVGAVFEGKF